MARRELQPCGTYGAWQRHKKAGEVPDEECEEAKQAYRRAYNAIRRRSTTPHRKAVLRASTRAQRALVKRYPEAFKALLDKELAKEGIR